MVYPGRYSCSDPTGGGGLITTSDANLAGDPRPRQQGTQYISWGVGGGSYAWQITQPLGGPITLGMSLGAVATNGNTIATYPTSFKIPLAYANYSIETATGLMTTNVGRNTVGTNPLTIDPAKYNIYPYGGFAREGDILETPFIGAYTIRFQTAGSTFTVAEMNSVTMDSVFAEDTDTQDDPHPRMQPECRETIRQHTVTERSSESTSGGSAPFAC